MGAKHAMSSMVASAASLMAGATSRASEEFSGCPRTTCASSAAPIWSWPSVLLDGEGVPAFDARRPLLLPDDRCVRCLRPLDPAEPVAVEFVANMASASSQSLRPMRTVISRVSSELAFEVVRSMAVGRQVNAMAARCAHNSATPSHVAASAWPSTRTPQAVRVVDDVLLDRRLESVREGEATDGQGRIAELQQVQQHRQTARRAGQLSDRGRVGDDVHGRLGARPLAGERANETSRSRLRRAVAIRAAPYRG